MSHYVRVSMLLVALLLLLMAPMALAQEYGESLGDLGLPGPGPYTPGETVSFSGDGFLPDSDVYLTLLAATDGAITDVGVVTADSAGAIAGSFVVPLEAGDDNYTVSATGVTPDGVTRILSGAIEVASPEDEPEATTTTEAEVVAATETSAATTTTEAAVEVPEALPFEGDDDGGSNTGLVITVGLLLLLAVGGVLWWRYRASTQ